MVWIVPMALVIGDSEPNAFVSSTLDISRIENLSQPLHQPSAETSALKRVICIF